MCLTTEPPPVRVLLCSREQGWEWKLACGWKPKEKWWQEQRGSSDFLVIRPVAHSELHSSHHAPRSALGLLCFIRGLYFHHYSYPKPPLIKMDWVSLLLVTKRLWRKLSTKELMLLNCGVGESLGLQGDLTSPFSRRSVLGVLWKEWC